MKHFVPSSMNACPTASKLPTWLRLRQLRTRIEYLGIPLVPTAVDLEGRPGETTSGSNRVGLLRYTSGGPDRPGGVTGPTIAEQFVAEQTTGAPSVHVAGNRVAQKLPLLYVKSYPDPVVVLPWRHCSATHHGHREHGPPRGHLGETTSSSTEPSSVVSFAGPWCCRV